MKSAWTFGTRPDGRDVTAYRIGDAAGLHATVLDYGGILQSLVLPDGTDVTLGYSTLEAYLKGDDYRGAVIGRNANRIVGADFSIDGTRYSLPANEGDNNLHSGPDGLDVQMWDVTRDGRALILRHISPDGHQGFPGLLDVELRIDIKDKTLRIDMRATASAPTPVNLTWHPYWNLHGKGRIDGHDLMVASDCRTVLDCPDARPVAETRFDFRKALPLGSVRVDDNYSNVREAVLRAGRTRLTVTSSLPDLQIYTGDALPDPRTGLALEPQFRPNDINVAGESLLRPGEVYAHWVEYAFVAN